MAHSPTPLQVETAVVEETVRADSSLNDSHNQLSSTPDGPLLCSLLERINRGIPKPTYKADPKCKTKYSVSEPTYNSRVRYPLNNYVSTCHLSESNKSFMNQLSTVYIPNSVQEALADPRWKEAMNAGTKVAEEECYMGTRLARQNLWDVNRSIQ